MPYLKALGRGVLDAGDSPRQGAVMKLVGNFFIISMIELIGEGFALADNNGLSRDAVVQFLKESFQGPITAGRPLLDEQHTDVYALHPGAFLSKTL